jgi:hypothetical protein
VALLPDARGSPGEVEGELPPQAGEAHRAPVDFDHRVVFGIALPDQNERVRHNRGLPLFERELLPSLHFSLEPQQLPPERRRQARQRDVQPGDRGRVAKELLLGLLSLPSPGELSSSVERVG